MLDFQKHDLHRPENHALGSFKFLFICSISCVDKNHLKQPIRHYNTIQRFLHLIIEPISLAR